MRYIKIFLICVFTLYISSCGRLKTPEELMKPPELNRETKIIKDALTEFLPQDSSIYSIPYSNKTGKEESFMQKDIDNDGEDEVLALYKSNTSNTYGVLILKEKNDKWTNFRQIAIVSEDLTEYKVEDIDKDGKYEIIMGYTEQVSGTKHLVIFADTGKKYEKIFNSPYYSFVITSDFDTGQKGNTLIVLSYIDKSKKENSITAYTYIPDRRRFDKKNTIKYPSSVEPYNIQIGQVKKNVNAIFVDMYVNLIYGKFDILSYKKGRLESLFQDSLNSLEIQNFPIPCSDIDGDGIIEIAKTDLVSNINDRENRTPVFVKKYYKFLDKDNFELTRVMYEDPFDVNVSINFPKEFWNKFIINKETYTNKITVYYQTNNSQIRKSFPLFSIRRVNLSRLDSYKDYIVISQDNNRVTFFTIAPYNDSIPEVEKSSYNKIYQIVKNPDTFIKAADY